MLKNIYATKMPKKSAEDEEREEEGIHIPKKLCFTKSRSTIKEEREPEISKNHEFLVAKKKVEQIQNAVTCKEVIVIEGPPGCGKTWTVREVLGTKLIDFDWLDFKNEASVVSFLKRCIFLSKENETVRILIDNADGMQEAMIKSLLNNRCEGQELIFIFNSIEPHFLFKDEHECQVIQLNPLTAAAIKKLVTHLDVQVPVKVANEIADACAGDARVAQSLMEEYNIHGSLMNHQRDNSLEFFHSLGKVLYPRKNLKAIWQLEHLNEEHFGLFNNYLHFNCIESISSLDDLSIVLDSFSLSQAQFSLKEHPARRLSFLVNSSKTKRKSIFGFHKPPPFYFKSSFSS